MTIIIVGTDGNDYLDPGFIAETVAMYGGEGNDYYVVRDLGDMVFELAGEGFDLIRTSLESYTLGSNVEQLMGVRQAGLPGHNFVGNGLNNLITTAGANDTITGGAGNDTMSGGAGADLFIVSRTQFQSASHEVITDFEVGVDHVQLADPNWTGRDTTDGYLLTYSRSGSTFSTTLLEGVHSILTGDVIFA